mgnify:CR=1 FL=1
MRTAAILGFNEREFQSAIGGRKPFHGDTLYLVEHSFSPPLAVERYRSVLRVRTARKFQSAIGGRKFYEEAIAAENLAVSVRHWR